MKSVPAPLRPFAARPGLTAAFVSLPLTMLLMPYAWRLSTRMMLSWDFAVLLFLVIATPTLIRNPEPRDIARRAERLDEGKGSTLVIAVLATIVALFAVGFEVAATRSAQGLDLIVTAGLTGVTVLLTWLFVHGVFTLHYAHEFYGDADDGDSSKRAGSADRRRGGLKFPCDGDDEDAQENDPDYWDFVHFGFVIAVANQTADVQISSQKIRHVVTVHGVVAFVFNTVIVAMLVNLLAALIGSH